MWAVSGWQHLKSLWCRFLLNLITLCVWFSYKLGHYLQNYVCFGRIIIICGCLMWVSGMFRTIWKIRFYFNRAFLKYTFFGQKCLWTKTQMAETFSGKTFIGKNKKKLFFTEVKCQHLSAVFRSLTTFLLFFFISI